MPLVLMMGDACGMRVAGAPSRRDQSLESRSQQPRPAGKSSPRSSKLFAFLKGCKTNKTATKLRKIRNRCVFEACEVSNSCYLAFGRKCVTWLQPNASLRRGRKTESGS